MSEPRPHPFTLVFAEIAGERFAGLREVFDGPPTLDEFLMANPVVELLHDLRPDDGLGDNVDAFVAFVHAAYRFWADGELTRTLDVDGTRALLEGRAGDPATPHMPPAVEYIQVAPRLIWSRLEAADAHEPLDGWFALPEGGQVRVVACLGVHPSRPGLSILTAEGAPPGDPARPDGTPAFAPRMEGGDTAGLASIATPAELLTLAWRATTIGGRT